MDPETSLGWHIRVILGINLSIPDYADWLGLFSIADASFLIVFLLQLH